MTFHTSPYLVAPAGLEPAKPGGIRFTAGGDCRYATCAETFRLCVRTAWQLAHTTSHFSIDGVTDGVRTHPAAFTARRASATPRPPCRLAEGATPIAGRLRPPGAPGADLSWSGQPESHRRHRLEGARSCLLDDGPNVLRVDDDFRPAVDEEEPHEESEEAVVEHEVSPPLRTAVDGGLWGLRSPPCALTARCATTTPQGPYVGSSSRLCSECLRFVRAALS